MKTYRTIAPIILADRSADGRDLMFFCSHCQREHTHGRHADHPDCPLTGHPSTPRARCECPTGSGDGHRVAHCKPGGPYSNHGYVLKETAA